MDHAMGEYKIREQNDNVTVNKKDPEEDNYIFVSDTNCDEVNPLSVTVSISVLEDKNSNDQVTGNYCDKDKKTGDGPSNGITSYKWKNIKNNTREPDSDDEDEDTYKLEINANATVNMEENNKIVNFTHNTTSRLIWYVSQKPVLYNLNSPLYKDNHARHSAWRDIAKELNMPVTECQVKWSTLRRCLANARKRQMKRRAKGGVEKLIKKWRYQDEMSFLTPFLDPRDSPDLSIHQVASTSAISNNLLLNTLMTQSLKEFGNSEEEPTMPLYLSAEYGIEDQEDPPDIKPNIENLHVFSCKPDIPYHRSSLQQEPFRSKECETYGAKRPFNETSLSSNSMDEMDSFFISMSKVVKKLPKLEQLKVRSQVYNVVTNAELKVLQNSHGTSSTYSNAVGSPINTRRNRNQRPMELYTGLKIIPPATVDALSANYGVNFPYHSIHFNRLLASPSSSDSNPPS